MAPTAQQSAQQLAQQFAFKHMFEGDQSVHPWRKVKTMSQGESNQLVRPWRKVKTMSQGKQSLRQQRRKVLVVTHCLIMHHRQSYKHIIAIQIITRHLQSSHKHKQIIAIVERMSVNINLNIELSLLNRLAPNSRITLLARSPN